MNGGNEIRQAEPRRRRKIVPAGASLAAIVAMMSLYIGAPPASAEMQTVTIGKAVDTIPFTVIDVAIDKGFFKNNGVDVKEVLLQGSSAANAAMVGGSLQFTCEAAVPLMLARSHGVPIIAVDALDDSVTLQLVASKQWLTQHPIAANASFKEKMTDIAGATLARVSTTDQAFYALLRSWAGLPSGGYRIEGLNSLAAISIAIQKGIVDVAIQSPPRSVELAESGYATLLVDRNDVEQLNNVAYDILTTTNDFAKQHPETTTKVATAVAQALNFMRTHPDETLAIEQKHFPKLDKSVLLKSIKFIPFAKNGLQSSDGWARAVKLAGDTGFVKDVKSAPEGEYWTNKYIDLSKVGN